MKLELEPVSAIEAIAEDQKRDFCNTIDSLLTWAVWAYSCGRNPMQEMMARPGGFTAWNERIRAKREIRELQDLYGRDE